MNEIRDTIGLALAPVGFVALLWILPRWWRNERCLHTDTPPPSWPWSLAFWHALVRIWMPIGITFLIAIPPAVITEFVVEGPVWVACNLVLVVGGVMLIVVTPWVALFNRPRLVIAPHHRALPGWLAERRGAPVPPVPEPAKPPRWHAALR